MLRMFLLWLCCMVCMPHPAAALAIWPFDNALAFDVQFEGVEEDLTKEYALEVVARDAIAEDKEPKNLNDLQSLATVMAARVKEKLVSEAYYDASARGYLLDNGDDKPAIVFYVTPNQRYTVKESRLKWEDNPILVENLDNIYLEVGAAATAQAILESRETLYDAVDDGRCFLAVDVSSRVILDKLEGTAVVEYRASHGRAADFGEVTFTGESAVRDEALQRYIKWEQGECFHQSKVDATQLALLQSKLLASVDITYPDIPNDARQVPVTIHVTDRPHRTVTAGMTYATNEGAGIKLGWEHRNLGGKARSLSASIAASQFERSGELIYREPYFHHEKQTLQLSGAISQETTDSFDAQSISVLGSVNRQLSSELLVGAGIGARFSRVEEAGEPTENFGLLYVPLYAEWETRNDITDATKGSYMRASVAPYTDVTGQGVGFVKTDFIAQTYLTAKTLPYTPTLALRGVYGQINGADTSSVPADLRFYSGGGGSVRGYNFRAIGPHDNGEPEGGTVWTELSAEARLRFSESFGGVAFMDAGTVYDGDAFDPNESLLTSVGLGVRYYSPIGPIRFDVGVPLDEVEDDTPFGVYISIGQAF